MPTIRKGRTTRRLAPPGYVAIDKNLAGALFDAGKSVTLCGNNVNSYHVFDGWHLGATFHQGENETLNVIVSHFMAYLEHELGTYPVFYVKKEDVAQ